MLKVYKNGEMIQRYDSSKIYRISKLTRLLKWEKGIKVYIRVNYKKEKDVFGKMRTFYNDGEYDNAKDLEKAWQAFIEK